MEQPILPTVQPSSSSVREHQVDIAYPTNETIVSLFVKQCKATPDSIAVVSGSNRLTYRELDEQSNQLAHYLHRNGVGRETLVPICLNRSVAMIVGALGILKAGGVYVPIDPDYPTDRIGYMLADLNSSLLVAELATRPAVALPETPVQVLLLDHEWSVIAQESIEALPVQIMPQDLAYIIYTSGSTGRPKGVMIEHRNVVRLFMTDAPLFDFGAQDVWTMFHSFCFDFSVWEMYGALLFGGRLVIVSREVAKDARLFSDLLAEERVTVLNQTPSAFYALQEQVIGRIDTLAVRYVIFGGEALNPAKLKPWHDAFPDCALINMYGITETTVHVTYLALSAQHLEKPSSLIGTAIPTLETYVLDGDQRVVAAGEPGELYVGGAGLARGYLNQPDLTASRYIRNPFATERGGRLYRSGDLVRQVADGGLEYLGRIDEQVKIRGYRIELGEIEYAMLQIAGIKEAVVLAKAGADGENRLIGYVVPETDSPFDRKAIWRFLATKLPDYMIPALLMAVDRIPLTTNGKVDRKALPNPDASALLTTSYKSPETKTEEKLAKVWKEILGVNRVGKHDNFFELGGTSLLAVKVVAQLKQRYQYDIPVTKLYQFPTVGTLSGYLEGNKQPNANRRKRNRESQSTHDVAIIGMSGRFPGADTVDALWTVLTEGRETIRFFADNELDPTLPNELTGDPAYVKARGILDQADQFDPDFFRLNSKLADVMDPQQRIFMEIAWEALEKSGYLPHQYTGSVGVWAGCGNNTYYQNNVLANQTVLRQIGPFQAMTVNEKDFIASRTAYQLNLTGPAVSVYSACSTSLLAITQAVESLRTGACDVAIAGGASVTAPVYSGHLYEEGAMLSRDGHCTPFDADASGTVFSDGAGVVLLKLLETAERDGDPIFAVIRGVGVNNDGGGKGSFTAPNAAGQAEAIRIAHDDAQVDPATITYVEAHGTATPLGDPIEIEGLSMAFGEQPEKQYCAIGSIKGNLGHLTAAAGVAGLIKTTLALHHQQIPPSIGFTAPNPAINFTDSPFSVNTKLTHWSSDQVRRAGVSSFGVGGTNVHVVLEEYTSQPIAKEADRPAMSRPVQLVTWSAKSAPSLNGYAARLANRLQQPHPPQIADVAFTLQTTRPPFSQRRFIVAVSREELLNTLTGQNGSPVSIPAKKAELVQPPGEVVFLFPGQGAQYLGMGHSLYQQEPVYRQAIDACADLLRPFLETDIREVLYADPTDLANQEQLKDTRYTQPALFVTEYALAQLWMSWGIQPTILCGHSIGEYVAAHLAGVFSLVDALRLVATRGQLISALPSGSMLSVRLNAVEVQPMLPLSLSIAAVNSQMLCVVSGPDDAIAEFSLELTGKHVPNRVLQTSHAFHSAMMEPAIAAFADVVGQIALKSPQKPIVSTVSGTWLTDAQATDPTYWATHMRVTVQFADALTTLSTISTPLLLEVGPGTALATLARQHLLNKVPVQVVASLAIEKGDYTEYQAIMSALGQLWLAGIEPDWKAFYADQPVHKIDLPTYAFDKKRCWVSPLHQQINEGMLPTEQNDHPQTTHILSTPMRTTTLLETVQALLHETSGVDVVGVSPSTSFLELGFDSLALTQISFNLRKKFDLPISFRQLNGEFGTLERLVEYLDQQLPADAYQPSAAPVRPTPPSPPAAQPVPAPLAVPVALPDYAAIAPAGNEAIASLFAQQLQIMAQQMAFLQGNVPSPPQAMAAPQAVPAQPIASAATSGTAVTSAPAAPSTPPATAPKADVRKPFGAGARIERKATALSESQQQFLDELTKRYNQKTAASKAYTQDNRQWMADPRVVTGFKPLTKELVYPLVVDKSKGSRLWDMDGNEFIDALNGFGSTMFGYQPDFLTQALRDQIDKGYELGPQHRLAGEVCRLVCEFTGFERAAICNTGSEAVMGTLRIARTVTGRSLVVIFSGSYHGVFDEVIARGADNLKSYPAALGILPDSVQNVLILDYGTEESLRIIKERAHELAAVLVEPVQSRRPNFQPIDFLRQVRAVTEASGTLLIFDEVITGFRMHPGGAQALFGVKADLATYGKVVGGGLPIGIIAGRAACMNALDGGPWQYGDASYPEADITFFAGTFIRHPLALAAANASLHYMKEQGPDLQMKLTAKAKQLANRLNVSLLKRQLPLTVGQFGSLWKITFTDDVPYGELLFTLMREKGIHIWDGFPCFMTEAHTEADVLQIGQAFFDSIDELIAARFITPIGPPVAQLAELFKDSSKPPVPNAKLGRDKLGNPGWFVADPNSSGKYLQLI